MNNNKLAELVDLMKENELTSDDVSLVELTCNTCGEAVVNFDYYMVVNGQYGIVDYYCIKCLLQAEKILLKENNNE